MRKQRELGIEDYLRMFWRRRWLVIIPATLGTLLGFSLCLVLPPRYTSHTTVLVQRPTVPDSYVKPVLSEDLSQRLASMKEQILSSTHMQELIARFGLYAQDIRGVPTEQLVVRLRNAIKVSSMNPMPGTRSMELPGFTVDVTLGEARLAQQICAEITSMFMQQNLELRQMEAEETTEFLAKQLEEAKAKLDDQDAKLAEFQSRYLGELPEDEKTNLTLLMGVNPELEATTQALNQARQDRTFTESMLSEQLAALKSSVEGENPETLPERLASLQNQLSSLRGHYTERHPDIVKLKGDIAEIQNKIRDGATQTAQENEKTPAIPIYEPPQIQHLRAQLHQIDQTIAQKTQEQAELQRRIKLLQGKIQQSPVIEQQFKALTRDYQSALDFYNELLKKQNESEMATELERHQRGEQFRILDVASLPQRPSFPKRWMFTLSGLGTGLILGLGMVQLAESRDKSMRSKGDVEFYLEVPVLGVLVAVAPMSRKKEKRESPNRSALLARQLHS